MRAPGLLGGFQAMYGEHGVRRTQSQLLWGNRSELWSRGAVRRPNVWRTMGHPTVLGVHPLALYGEQCMRVGQVVPTVCETVGSGGSHCMGDSGCLEGTLYGNNVFFAQCMGDTRFIHCMGNSGWQAMGERECWLVRGVRVWSCEVLRGCS